jgi:hypothetical protein
MLTPSINAMKTSLNKLSSLSLLAMLGAAFGFVASSASAAIVTTYDWAPTGDQGMQGWTNVLNDTTGISDDGVLTNPFEYADAGNRLGAPGGVQADYEHSTLVVASPTFQIGATAVQTIGFDLQSGMGSGSLVADFSSLPENSSGTGFLGMALMRVSDGAYLLDASKAANDGAAELFEWNSTALNTAISGDLSTETYRLHLIDYDDSGWGHVQTSTVTLTAIPEPGSYALLAGLAGMAFVMARRRI